jgi:hypothetical protein
VGLAVDHQRTRSADALAAVVVEGDRLAVLCDQPFVQDVEQFEEGSLVADRVDAVALEMTLDIRALLPPYLECQVGEVVAVGTHL